MISLCSTFGLIGNAQNILEEKSIFIIKQRELTLDIDWFSFKYAKARSRKTCKKAYNYFISSLVASDSKDNPK